MKFNRLFLALNTFYCLIIIFFLFFLSLFSLGSLSQMKTSVKNSPLLYFLGRFVIDFVFVLFCCFIVLLLNLIVKRLTNTYNFQLWRIFFLEVIITLAFGALFIIASMVGLSS